MYVVTTHNIHWLLFFYRQNDQNKSSSFSMYEPTIRHARPLTVQWKWAHRMKIWNPLLSPIFVCRSDTCLISISRGVVNQAYSRLSTTHGHITDCKLDSVVFAGVCVVIFNVDLSCLGRTIYARQFLGAKPPIQKFRHRWVEGNHSDHLYGLRAAQSVA